MPLKKTFKHCDPNPFCHLIVVYLSSKLSLCYDVKMIWRKWEGGNDFLVGLSSLLCFLSSTPTSLQGRRVIIKRRNGKIVQERRRVVMLNKSLRKEWCWLSSTCKRLFCFRLFPWWEECSNNSRVCIWCAFLSSSKVYMFDKYWPFSLTCLSHCTTSQQKL